MKGGKGIGGGFFLFGISDLTVCSELDNVIGMPNDRSSCTLPCDA